MTLSEMRATVRRDLHDEDGNSYRWTDEELDRHIAHAVKDFSGALPQEVKAIIATSTGSREVDLSGLDDLLMVEAVEYPVDLFPQRYQRFAVWGDTLTMLGEEVPDGSGAAIYYGKLHTLDTEGSTIWQQYEDLVATGAAGYAAVEWAVYAINRVNVGGTGAAAEFLGWGKEKLRQFLSELKRLGRRNRVRARSLYQPYYPVVSKSTDYGP